MPHEEDQSPSGRSNAALTCQPRTRECQNPRCGRSFVARRPSGAQRRGTVGWAIYCSRACKDDSQRKYASRKEKRRAAAGRRCAKPKASAMCSHCGNDFQIRAKGQLYCSAEECRKARARARYKVIAHKIAKPSRQWRCDVCDKAFRSARFRRTCSQRCSDALESRISNNNRRAKYYGVPCERFSPIEVFKRDGWRCYLCGVNTPRTARGTSADNAPELDHIVALSRGGAHSMANTACACRRCNGIKHANGAEAARVAVAAGAIRHSWPPG